METVRFIKAISIVLLLIGFNSCKGQNTQEEKFKPDVKISVNKDYDKDNNMIRYDSSYSYSYSSSGSFPPDSLFAKLKWPKIHEFGLNSMGYKNPLQTDSLFNFFNSTFLDDKFFNSQNFFDSFYFRNPKELEEKFTKKKNK